MKAHPEQVPWRPAVGIQPRVTDDLLPLDLARRIRDSLQRQALLGDENYYGKVFETDLTELGIDLIRPTRSKEKPRPRQEFLEPLRQIITHLEG